MQIVVVMATRWAGDHTVTHISLRNYESTTQRLNFCGNLWTGKQGRASCPDFSRGKVHRLAVVTEAAMRRRSLGRRFARAGAWESGMGRKKTHFDFFPFLASKPAFFSQAARRSSTVTVGPSACLFQSLDRIIFGMTHTYTK